MSEAVVSSPRVFDFEDHAVRILGTPDEPWFVAADVCRVLEIANSRDAISSLDGDEKGVATTDTLGGKQDVTIINESGLYSLIFRSRKPQAKAFKRWVTHEVLPAIRKTGKYVTPEVAASEGESIPDPLWTTPIEFLEATEAVHWDDQRKAEFFRRCRKFTVTLGADYRRKRVAGFGLIQEHPVGTLREVLRNMRSATARPAPGSAMLVLQDEIGKVLAATVAGLDSHRELRLRDILTVARERGVCRELITERGTVSPAASKAAGHRLRAFIGKSLKDEKGREFVVFKGRNKRGTTYSVHFLGSEVAE